MGDPAPLSPLIIRGVARNSIEGPKHTMHFSPRLKHETRAIVGYPLLQSVAYPAHQSFLNGFEKISQLSLVVPESHDPGPATRSLWS